jgi:DeoR/GlpR family transcriptional regulator of sugar metabolism
MERLQMIRRLLLENNGMKAEELHEMLEVTRGTIFRDLREIGTRTDDDGVHYYVPTEEEVELAKLIIKANNIQEESE